MWLEHTGGALLASTQHSDISLEAELKSSSSETTKHSLTNSARSKVHNRSVCRGIRLAQEKAKVK